MDPHLTVRHRDLSQSQPGYRKWKYGSSDVVNLQQLIGNIIFSRFINHFQPSLPRTTVSSSSPIGKVGVSWFDGTTVTEPGSMIESSSSFDEMMIVDFSATASTNIVFQMKRIGQVNSYLFDLPCFENHWYRILFDVVIKLLLVNSWSAPGRTYVSFTKRSLSSLLRTVHYQNITAT